jgi:hypothetical protein
VGTPNAVTATMGGILLQTMLPLGIGLFLNEQVPALAAAGVFGLMMPAFLVALATKTSLVLWLLAPYRTVAKAS